MPPKNNYLVIEIPTLGSKKESLTFKHVPFQKALNVTIAIDNRNGFWINGNYMYRNILTMFLMQILIKT